VADSFDEIASYYEWILSGKGASGVGIADLASGLARPPARGCQSSTVCETITMLKASIARSSRREANA
jgi:hypothetical protein